MALLLVAVDPVCGAQAQERNASSLYDLDIPASSVEVALDRYARATGIPLLYEVRQIAGRRSKGVRGRLSARAALHALLEGTGLEARYTRKDAVTIVPLDSGVDAPLLTLRTMAVPVTMTIGDRVNYAGYVAVVRKELYDVLRVRMGENARFRVRFRLWLDREGRIERISSEEGTVSDRALADAVHNARISQPPPAKMPQPLRFELERR